MYIFSSDEILLDSSTLSISTSFKKYDFIAVKFISIVKISLPIFICDSNSHIL